MFIIHLAQIAEEHKMDFSTTTSLQHYRPDKLVHSYSESWKISRLKRNREKMVSG